MRSRTGQANVVIQLRYPGQGLVRSHCVVLDPVVLRMQIQGQGVGDLLRGGPWTVRGFDPAQ